MNSFNYDPFGSNKAPSFETAFDIKAGKKIKITLSASIEDVEFVEIIDETEKKPKSLNWDKGARDLDIWREALKHASDIKSFDGGFAQVSYAIIFESGAKWSDEHPKSNFNHDAERFTAFREAMEKEIEELQQESIKRFNKREPNLTLIFVVVSTAGFHWATQNPPKYY